MLPNLISLAVMVFEEDTLKTNEIIALPTLIAAVILFRAFFHIKIYYGVISFLGMLPTKNQKGLNINSTRNASLPDGNTADCSSPL